jgi:hypothetical protein
MALSFAKKHEFMMLKSSIDFKRGHTGLPEIAVVYVKEEIFKFH